MIWVIGICCICLGICMPMYLYYKRSSRIILGTSYKSAGTLCAFSSALVAAIRLDPRCWICAIAILIYALADYILEFNFMLGAGIFLAGHICISSFFLSLAPVSMIHMLCLLILGGFSLFVLWRWRKPIGKKFSMILIYGISLLFMCTSALGCISVHTTAGILISFGGALFFISDMFLLRRITFASSRAYDWAVMITYYSSVLLFGIACLNI